jgi:hypothetical protein
VASYGEPVSATRVSPHLLLRESSSLSVNFSHELSRALTKRLQKAFYALILEGANKPFAPFTITNARLQPEDL